MLRPRWLPALAALVLGSAGGCKKSEIQDPPLPPVEAGSASERTITDYVPQGDSVGDLRGVPDPGPTYDGTGGAGGGSGADYSPPDTPPPDTAIDTTMPVCNLLKQDCPKVGQACFPDEGLSGGLMCLPYGGSRDTVSPCGAHSECDKGWVCMITSASVGFRRCTPICPRTTCPPSQSCKLFGNPVYEMMSAGYCHDKS